MSLITNYKLYLAIFYIIYGMFRIFTAIMLYFFAPEIASDLPLVSMLLHDSEDHTLAGRMYEYIGMVFGIYTITQGLALLQGLSVIHVFSKSALNFYESRQTQYTILIMLGLAICSFYGLVIYSDLPISKDPKSDYRLTGFGTGLSFLMMPLLWEIIMYYSPFIKHQIWPALLLTTMCVCSVAGLAYFGRKRSPDQASI